MPAGRGINRTGRSKSKNYGDYMSLPRDLMRSKAYRALSTIGKVTLCFLAFSYDGRNNGELEYGARNSEFFGEGKSQAAEALKELEALGFIAKVRPGWFGSRRGKPAVWRLTWRPSGRQSDGPATHDYLRANAAAALDARRKTSVRPAGRGRPAGRTASDSAAGVRPADRTMWASGAEVSSGGPDNSYVSQPGDYSAHGNGEGNAPEPPTPRCLDGCPAGPPTAHVNDASLATSANADTIASSTDHRQQPPLCLDNAIESDVAVASSSGRGKVTSAEPKPRQHKSNTVPHQIMEGAENQLDLFPATLERQPGDSLRPPCAAAMVVTGQSWDAAATDGTVGLEQDHGSDERQVHGDLFADGHRRAGSG